MTSSPPSYSSSASVSRSRTSQRELGSLADQMLRASLARGDPSSPSAEPVTDSMLRASVTRSVSSPMSSPASHLSKGPAVPTSRSISAGTVGGLVSNSASASRRASSWSSGISAAEEKHRLRQLRSEVSQTKAAAPPRATTGLFKESCSTDLLFLIDTTGSMRPYIDTAKQQVAAIMDDVKAAFLNEANVRISVVGYKDHGNTPNIEFLDFTSSADDVRRFLGQLKAVNGYDVPEDVLGGVQQALNASWRQHTRCVIHIADAPGHGRALHDFSERQDNYYKAGSEPHRLTYAPLFKKLVQLNMNYALLRINNSTDRMALAFSQVYVDAGAEGKLDESNVYHSKASGGPRSTKHVSAGPQFEELRLGTSYSMLRHLVVSSVSSSVSRTANRLSMTVSSGPSSGRAGGKAGKLRIANLTAIREDGDTGGDASDVPLEKGDPRWDTPGWLDETLQVEGFCPDTVVHSAGTLNDMMASDDNIKLSMAELTIYARSKPFDQGSVRLAYYARTAASSNRFVVKSFKKGEKGLSHVVEDMQAQALCKAFALEFNGLLKTEHPLDFVVTTCLQSKSRTASSNGGLSLEPFLDGEFVKYNSNGLWVKEDSPDDPFNRLAQAFSHFTFERSWGHFLVADLQGVNQSLTDPAIHTRDQERFKLSETNLHEEGFKFFFALHKCNAICHRLELKSNAAMLMENRLQFRERWPTMEPTVCCSNKLCRRIIRLASASKSDRFPGYHWCNVCSPQLQSSTVRWPCVAPGPNHEFEVSRFFYESQGKGMPHECPDHRQEDTTVSSAAVVGGSLWNKMKMNSGGGSIPGRGW
ncbi:hypothetical protein GGR56DRAFT_667436 [Xylariaceae sp. FL0804]|nr:hypothetical protein GGR56DRAFT_667436 [Xylariaceae sp. FL0804]